MLNISNYLRETTNKIFKILPLKEENNIYLSDYLESLSCDLTGAIKTFPILKDEYNYITIVNTINYLYGNEAELKFYRREVFRMLNCLDRLKLQIRMDVM